MLIETLSVREISERLPSVLERFRQGDRTPIGVGSHRKTEAVLIPVAVFEELAAEHTSFRARAAAFGSRNWPPLPRSKGSPSGGRRGKPSSADA